MTDLEQAEIHRKRMEEILNKKLSELMEHFSVVRIFAQWEDTANQVTMGKSTGSGNFYAQSGQIREWVENMDEIVRIDARENHEEG